MMRKAGVLLRITGNRRPAGGNSHQMDLDSQQTPYAMMRNTVDLMRQTTVRLSQTGFLMRIDPELMRNNLDLLRIG